MITKLNIINENIQLFEKKEEELKKDIEQKKQDLSSVQEKLFSMRQEFFYLSEIEHLAELHFSRLRKQTNKNLTQSDYNELNKFINRAKSIEGIIDIAKALNELSKYYSEDIRCNLYGLVQKIIIEGPFKKKFYGKT